MRISDWSSDVCSSDLSADERDTRGFISITTTRPFSELMPNCTLLPPVSTPILRSTAMEASRRRWYSLSVSVCAGATVIESPVCTPIGSKFSMLHTLMQRSEEHTSELQTLMSISYDAVWLKKKTN